MQDPLSSVIAMLEPRTVLSKRISGAGRWAVRYEAFDHPSFSVVLQGSCRLAVDGEKVITLEAGDFVLLPATPGFVMSGFHRVTPTRVEPTLDDADEVRYGTPDGPADVTMLGGYFVFDSPNAPLLVSMLPGLIHLRDVERLQMLVRLIGAESLEQRAGRDLVLARMAEILLVEALRLGSGEDAPPGLVRGLADPALARALREMHNQLTRAWTVVELAKVAGLSRSAFFARFSQTVGIAPMEYLTSWRMAVAKDLLAEKAPIQEVAEKVGYGSASTFSTAFRRHVGQPPSQFARRPRGFEKRS